MNATQEITGIKIKLLQNGAKADAKRKRGGLTSTGYAAANRVMVNYYPHSQRFAYFLDGRRVNRADIEKEW